jgi:hypothetical protein
MRGPAAGTALFALALLTAQNGLLSPWSASTPTTTTASTTGRSHSLAAALELDPMLAAYEGGPPQAKAAAEADLTTVVSDSFERLCVGCGRLESRRTRILPWF